MPDCRWWRRNVGSGENASGIGVATVNTGKTKPSIKFFSFLYFEKIRFLLRHCRPDRRSWNHTTDNSSVMVTDRSDHPE